MQQNISNDCCNVEGVPQTLNQTYLLVDAIKYLNSSLKPSMQFYPYFLKSSISSKSSCLVFWFIYTCLMAMPEKLYLRCHESLFSTLNGEVILWQKETESKGWKDQVDFETQNLQWLNIFPIWKLAFSQPHCTWHDNTRKTTHGKNHVIVRQTVYCLPFCGHALI